MKSTSFFGWLALLALHGTLNTNNASAQTWSTEQDLCQWFGDPATPGTGVHASTENSASFSATLATAGSGMSGGSGVTMQILASNSETYTFYRLASPTVDGCSPAAAITNNDYISATVTLRSDIRTLRVSSAFVNAFTGDGIPGRPYQFSFAARDVTAGSAQAFSFQGVDAVPPGGGSITFTGNAATPGWSNVLLVPGHTYEFRWYVNRRAAECATANSKDIDNPGINVEMVNAISISGTVFNDFDGPVNGISNLSGAQVSGLHAVLVNANGTVAAVTTVNATSGIYTFAGIDPISSTSFRVMLSTSNPTVGQSAPATATLPSGWFSTGESNGTGTSNDGTANGISTNFAPTANTTNINFGLNQPPVATADNLGNQTPGSAATIPNLLVNDTDPNGGTLLPANISLVAPSGATGITTDAQGDVIGFTVPGQGAWTLNSSTGALTFTPQAGFTADPTPFNYTVTDAAGLTSTPATVTIDYNSPVTVSGTVYNDNNGTIGGANGTPLSGATVTLYAADGTTVLATTPTDAIGNYSFPNQVPGNYVIGVTSSAGYQNVSSTDATPGDGKTSVTVGSIAVSGVNFGVNQPPTANTTTASSSTPPAGNANVSIAPSGFGGTDPNSGVIDSLRITGFPTNTASITIGTTTYYPDAGSIPSGCATCAVFPVNGITVPTNATGQPFVAISVDPTGTTATTVVIPYTVIDNAHLEDATPGSLTLPFGAPLPVEWLYFQAKADGDDAVLEWATAQEVKTERFEAEFATPGNGFQKLGEVVAAGNSSSTSTYHLKHKDAARLGASEIQYRIRQVDRDGRYAYSETRIVWIKVNIGTTVIYPNPLSLGTALTIIAGQINAIVIMDATGRVVYKNHYEGLSKVTLPSDRLRAGTYFIRINGDNTGKLIVK